MLGTNSTAQVADGNYVLTTCMAAYKTKATDRCEPWLLPSTTQKLDQMLHQGDS